MVDSRQSSDNTRSAHTEESFEHIPPPHVVPNSLSHEVYLRRSEYTRPHTIKIKIGTWNVAACPDVERDVGHWFVQGRGVDPKLAGHDTTTNIQINESQAHIESVPDQEERHAKKQPSVPLGDKGTALGGNEIGLYVLGLQEIVELSSASGYMGKVYVDPGPAYRWKKAVSDALPDGYVFVAEQQLSGLFMVIYASPEIAPSIGSVSSVSIGTGFLGYMGNKGAVVTRIVLGETTRLVFVNSHLASGTDATHLDRRCWDVAQILTRTQFEPVVRGGVVADAQESIGDEDFAFWFGDLNFRLTGLPGSDIRRLLMLHTQGEYGRSTDSKKKIDSELAENDEPIVIHHVDSDDDSTIASTPRTSTADDGSSSVTLPDPDDFIQDPHDDPLSIQATIDSLLPHDQLRHVQNAGKAFHDGWREGPITFLPTYKYDVGSVGMFDSSEKRRAPSWCDRILFRTSKDKHDYDIKHMQEIEAKKKDADMKSRGLESAGDEDQVLFDYDPEADGEGDDGPHESGDGYDEYDEAEEHPGIITTKEDVADKLDLESYVSHQRVISSDHKPLDAVFTLRYDAVVPELRSQIQAEVARELDRAENEGRPGVTVVVDSSQDVDDFPKQTGDSPQLARKTSSEATNGVDFGEVRYLSRKSRALTIANTGAVPATFAFAPRPAAPGEPDRIAPEWLSVRFVSPDNEEEKSNHDSVTLDPGDAINAILSVYVHQIDHVRSLNEERISLEDVLVLRVTDGRDYFVPLRGTWMQSCLARSIAELIRVPEGGVRALVPSRKGDHEGGPINRGQPACWSAPRELFKLTESCQVLTERAVAESEMIEGGMGLPSSTPTSTPISASWPFDSKSWKSEVSTRDSRMSLVLEALDTDSPLIEALDPGIPAAEKLEIIAGSLVLFLAGLSDGIVTVELWAKMAEELKSRHGLSNASSPGGNARKSGGSSDDSRTLEEEKSWVLDVLSAAPNHNIALVFLTTTLAKMAGELAPVPVSAMVSAAVAGAQPAPTVSSGLAAAGSKMRRSLSLRGRLSGGGGSSSGSSEGSSSGSGSAFVSPNTTSTAAANDGKASAKTETPLVKRQLLEARWAEIFAPVVFRGPMVVMSSGAPPLAAAAHHHHHHPHPHPHHHPVKEKERRWIEERRREILGVFLRGER